MMLGGESEESVDPGMVVCNGEEAVGQGVVRGVEAAEGGRHGVARSSHSSPMRERERVERELGESTLWREFDESDERRV